MSRSTPTLTNPAKHFFTWKAGKVVYYDKEKQTDIEIKLPFEFLVLDQLATMTGFCEPDSSGYWSNEVRNITKEPLTVKTAKGIKQAGLYKDLADVRSKGAKYAKSIYLAYFDAETEEYTIGNLKASGAVLTAWIELSKRYNVENGKVCLTGSIEAKKGATVYQVPVFEWVVAEIVEDEAALKLDKELQVYLNQYLNPRSNVLEEQSSEDWIPTDEELNATLSDDIS